MSEPLTLKERLEQLVRDADDLLNLANRVAANAEAVNASADLAYRLVKVEDIEEALSEARRAGIAQGLGKRAVVADMFWRSARTLLGLAEQET